MEHMFQKQNNLDMEVVLALLKGENFSSGITFIARRMTSEQVEALRIKLQEVLRK